MTPETQQKLTEATLALEAEGCRVWGFVFQPGDGPVEPFSTFSGSDMSRALLIHNTEVALEILKDNDIRSIGESEIQVYEA